MRPEQSGSGGRAPYPPLVVERKPDGVVLEDGIWSAYLNGALIACGPDKRIIQAAYDHHASADEYRSGPHDDA